MKYVCLITNIQSSRFFRPVGYLLRMYYYYHARHQLASILIKEVNRRNSTPVGIFKDLISGGEGGGGNLVYIYFITVFYSGLGFYRFVVQSFVSVTASMPMGRTTFNDNCDDLCGKEITKHLSDYIYTCVRVVLHSKNTELVKRTNCCFFEVILSQRQPVHGLV